MTTSTTNANRIPMRNWFMAFAAIAAVLAIIAVGQWLSSSARVTTTDSATVSELTEANPSADVTRFGGALSDWEFVDNSGTEGLSANSVGDSAASTNGRGLEAYASEGGLLTGSPVPVPVTAAPARPTILGGHQE